jgi:hypothetical protein
MVQKTCFHGNRQSKGSFVVMGHCQPYRISLKSHSHTKDNVYVLMSQYGYGSQWDLTDCWNGPTAMYSKSKLWSCVEPRMVVLQGTSTNFVDLTRQACQPSCIVSNCYLAMTYEQIEEFMSAVVICRVHKSVRMNHSRYKCSINPIIHPNSQF